MGTPMAPNSSATYPAPTPTMSRPFATTSMLASSLASTTGLRYGSTMMPLASVIVDVLAARNPSDTMVSSSGSVGGSENPAGCGSGSTQCSPVQTESKP